MITATRILLNQHIDLYNIKLILSCLKQTPILVMVTPTRVITPEEVDRTKEALMVEAATVTIAIA